MAPPRRERAPLRTDLRLRSEGQGQGLIIRSLAQRFFTDSSYKIMFQQVGVLVLLEKVSPHAARSLSEASMTVVVLQE